MDYPTYTRRIAYLKSVLEKGWPSSPQTLATRFSCSKRTVRRMINTLRAEGLDIGYDRSTSKYFLRK